MDGQQTKAVHQIEVRDVNGTPNGREPIRWKLVTNLPVACKAETGLQTLRVTVLEPTLVSNKPWSPTNLGLQQLPITTEETVGDGGTDCVGHMAVQGILAIGDDHHIRRILDLNDLVPGIVDEAVVVLVGGQIAVAVVGGGAADGGDFVLLVGRPCLGRAVGSEGIPVADGVVVPRLAA